MSKEVESLTKDFSIQRIPGPEGFTGEFHQTFKELMPIFLKLFQKNLRSGTLPSSFYKARITLILGV